MTRIDHKTLPWQWSVFIHSRPGPQRGVCRQVRVQAWVAQLVHTDLRQKTGAVLVDTFLTAEASQALADGYGERQEFDPRLLDTHGNGDHFFGIGAA